MLQFVQRWYAAREPFRSIKARTRFVTVVGLLAMLLAGASMLVSVVELEGNSSQLRRNIYVVGVTLREMKTDVQRIDAELERLARTPSPLALRRFRRVMGEIDETTERRLETLSQTTTSAPQGISDVARAYSAWAQVRAQIVDAFAKERSVLAYTLAKTEGAGLVAELEKHLDALLVLSDRENAEIWSSQERVLYATTPEYTTQGKMTSLFGLESDRFGQVRRQA